MIVTLEGLLAEKYGSTVVLECSGVGYGVFVSLEDFGTLEGGNSTKLYIYEHIRENVHDLFGFRTPEAKLFFEQLLSVNGVGPRMALAILSIANLQQVRLAIASGDIKFITRASGVGRRVAERIVVDLKDKVGLVADPKATDFLATPITNSDDEALQGLVALGYSIQDATKALKDIDAKLSSEQRIKQALKTR